MKLLSVLLLCFSSATAEEFNTLNTQQSSVTFVSKQMGVPVAGSFKKFSADIAVNPAKPETGSARISIDLNSMDAGSAEANDELGSRSWFDTKQHPVARFVSSQVTRTGDDRYEALGNMTIKGKTLSVKAPFTLKRVAGVVVIDGIFPIKRLDYGIGTGIWADTSVVADEVKITFHFTVGKPH
ncbi:MAG: YceI family protein [Gallionella sp.]|nr:YceI family protein [Gallionella sp.]MDP1942027.1 YceI family protein [Gallionella sp.]